MKKIVLAALVAVLVGLGVWYGVAASSHHPKAANTGQKTATVAKPPTRAELLKLVNTERAKHGVAPLKESKILDKSAQWKADDMLKYHYYDHVKPGTKGNDGLDYLNSLEPPCSYISENLDENSTAQAAVTAWVHSKPHFKAMIDPSYTLTGFGIAGKDKNGYYLFTEHFCRP